MKELILFLVILNPFSQILYLSDLMNELKPREFVSVHLKASLISGAIFVVFALVGETLLDDVFQIRLASLQIFGGLILLVLAYRYVIVGPGSNLFVRGDLSEMAQKISLPYMVGPGTLWVSMSIGSKYDMLMTSALIAGVLLINFVFVTIYNLVLHKLSGPAGTHLAKYFSILMRTNAFLIGAVAIEMIIKGAETVIAIA